MARATMDYLKVKFTKPPVLALPSINFQNTVGTNVCYRQVGYVLLKYQREGPMRSMGYWSRSLENFKRIYYITQL